MKKFLAVILAVFMTVSVVVGFSAFADEEAAPVAEEAPAAEETPAEDAVPAQPSEEDTNSMMHYIVFDFTDEANLSAKVYLTGTDALIDYYKNLYTQYGTEVSDAVYNGKKAIIVQEVPLEKDGLSDIGLAAFEDKGFFGTKTTYAYLLGDPSQGSEEIEPGKVMQIYVFDLGSRPSSYKNAIANKDGLIKEVKAGENNSFMFTTYKFNWVNCLIALMILLAVILIVIIIAKKKKNGNNDEKADLGSNNNAKKIAVDDIMPIPVEEAAEEIKEKVEEAEETAEEIKTEAEEVKEENSEEKSE